MARYTRIKKLPIQADQGIYVGSTPTQAISSTGTLLAGNAVVLKDSAGQILLATGTTVPTDGATIYAKGALFIDTDVASGTSGLYVNVGTSASCTFKLVSNAT